MATLREYPAPNPRLHAVFCGGYRRGDGHQLVHTTLSIPLRLSSNHRKTSQCLHSKVDHNNLFIIFLAYRSAYIAGASVRCDRNHVAEPNGC